MSATWVECLYCGHVLVCVEGQSAGDIRAAALIHDDSCPNNPHVAKAKRLEAELEAHAWEVSPAMAQAKINQLNIKNEKLQKELADAKAQLSAGRPKT